MLLQEVSSNKNGIGYVGLAYSHGKGTSAVTVDGKPPTAALVKSYPYSRPTFFYTNGDAKENVKAFVNFCLSPAGEQIAQAVGFVPLSVAK